MWVNFSLILPSGSQSACWLTTICHNVIVTLVRKAGTSETCFKKHVNLVVWLKCDSLPTFVFNEVGYSDYSRWHWTLNSNFVTVHETNVGFMWVFVCPVLQVLLMNGVMGYNVPHLLLDCSLIYLPSISETDNNIANALVYHVPWAIAQNL